MSYKLIAFCFVTINFLEPFSKLSCIYVFPVNMYIFSPEMSSFKYFPFNIIHKLTNFAQLNHVCIFTSNTFSFYLLYSFVPIKLFACLYFLQDSLSPWLLARILEILMLFTAQKAFQPFYSHSFIGFYLFNCFVRVFSLIFLVSRFYYYCFYNEPATSSTTHTSILTLPFLFPLEISKH